MEVELCLKFLTLISIFITWRWYDTCHLEVRVAESFLIMSGVLWSILFGMEFIPDMRTWVVDTARLSPSLSLAETCVMNRIVRVQTGKALLLFVHNPPCSIISRWPLFLDIPAHPSCLPLNRFFTSCGQTSDFIMSDQGHSLPYTVLTGSPFPE